MAKFNIAFPNTQNLARFFSKCLFDNINDRDRCMPVFSQVNETYLMFLYVIVEGDRTENEVKAMLAERKVKYLHVTEIKY